MSTTSISPARVTSVARAGGYPFAHLAEHFRHALKRRSSAHKDAGFTLPELAIAVFIFGTLAAIAIPFYLNQQEAVASKQLEVTMLNASIAIEAERAQKAAYPVSLPTEVTVPDSVVLTYFQGTDGRTFCAEAFDRDSNPDEVFRIRGDMGGSSPENRFQPGACPAGEALAPLDTPVLESHLDTSNHARLTWSPVPSAERYTLTNLTTGEVIEYNGSSTTVYRSPEPLEEANEFQVTAYAEGRSASVSRVVEVEPIIVEIDLMQGPELRLKDYVMLPGTTSYTLEWTAPERLVAQYRIYDPNSGQQVGWTAGNQISFSSSVTSTTWFHVQAVFFDGSTTEVSNPVEVVVSGI